MKPITFSQHARLQMAERGADDEEVVQTFRPGEEAPAKRGRLAFRKNFQFERVWGERTFAIKQVLAIVAESPDELVVVTVYTLYF